MKLQCSKCKLEKEETMFRVRPNRLRGFSSRCKVCLSEDNKNYNNTTVRKRNRSDYYWDNREVISEKRRNLRKNPLHRARHILSDSKKYDKNRDLSLDLDLSFISEIISKPCFYCGDNSLMKTLDRIDNTIGHTKNNVVCACSRCNYLRRDMPYQAWLIIARSVKICRQQNLFGEWVGSPTKN